MAAPEIRTLALTGSTNADMLALAARGAVNEGVWLRAERQTAGRGRMNRTWEGEGGNLFASTLVQLRPADPPAHSLALVAAVAVHQALERFAPASGLRIKWPNDILAGPSKLCGILLERTGNAVVAGVGVNVCSHPHWPDRPATSLRALGVELCDAATVCEEIAVRFAEWVEQWRLSGLACICEQWRQRAHPAGTRIAASLPDGQRIEGAFEALDPHGALILRLASGERHAIHTADVFLL